MRGYGTMSGMMNGHWIMGAVGVLVVIGLLLGVAALIKYLFFSSGQ